MLNSSVSESLFSLQVFQLKRLIISSQGIGLTNNDF